MHADGALCTVLVTWSLHLGGVYLGGLIREGTPLVAGLLMRLPRVPRLLFASECGATWLCIPACTLKARTTSPWAPTLLSARATCPCST